ncbi:hypothetical protein KGF57_002858 [Candida theae]|uniref:Uncharacterized protein n=1 Tax=Candida theae TaxID=1198502 RepID=A0AAD5FYH7_9ASCO|nr:uncharacterized protein KGF57_002858 [Candida theae]KAI5958050.1 hypothetical protein KGF57_002858 [Candida theae]
MTDTSNGTELSDQFQSTSDNVDEMFDKLSVSEIQRLSSQYSTIIATTKSELHNLVSEKYRDLIKIAEDIGDLKSISSTIEESLHGISYKPSTFVSPYKDKYVKFDSILRDQNAARARESSRSVIVRSIIQKRLAKLANKTTPGGSSPLLHTSNFIPFVKELYTIETVFKDVLSEKRDLQLQMHYIKQQLIDYFEYEISVYNSPISPFSSNDKFNPRLRFLERDFTTEKFVDDISFLEDDFDQFQGDDNDDNDKVQEKREQFDKLDTFKNTNYYRNVSPMCIYLVCYTVIAKDITSAEDVKHKLIDLRTSYLSKLLSASGENNHSINYRSVLLYLENTCNYLKSYLGETSGSDYFQILQDVSKPWSLVDLVGHKGWIEDILVDFGTTVSIKEEEFKVEEGDFDKVMEFLKLVSSTLQSSSPTFDDLFTTIAKYYNFILSLKRLKDVTRLAGSQSQLVQLVSSSTLVDDLSKDLESLIKEINEEHMAKLMSEKGLLGLVRDILDSSVSQLDTHTVFDTSIVNLMDYNVGEYMKVVLNNSNRAKQNSLDTTHQLKLWLNECYRLEKIIDFDRDASELMRGKRQNYDYLPQLYHNLHNDDIKWGDFTADCLKERFQALYTTINESFKHEVSNFSSVLLNLSSNEDEVSKLIYLTGLLTRLRDDIELNTTENDTKQLISAIDSNVDEIVQKVVSQVLNDQLQALQSLVVTKEATMEGFDIPTRPTLQFASRMHEIAQVFLTQATKMEVDNINLFSNSSSTSQAFIKMKNAWFEMQIESFVSRVGSNDSGKVNQKISTFNPDGESKNKEEKNEPENNTDSEQPKTEPDQNHENTMNETESANTNARASTLQIAANIAFLQLFHKPNVDAKGIKHIIDSVNKTEPYSENTLEIISSGVSSFYRSRQNVYLPLSL